MLDRTIILYADDFDCDVWKDYCDIVGVSHHVSSITIKFDHSDVEVGEECGEEEDEDEEEEPTESLTIEYRHKETGLNFVRFNAEDNEEPIQLYCSDDSMGEKDTRVSLETLNKEYDEIARYMEED